MGSSWTTIKEAMTAKRMPMFFYLFLLFTLVPLIELAILIKIGTWIGVFPTLALVIGTGGLGAYLARRQGLRVIQRMNAELACGLMPEDALFDGILVLVGGVLLVTPGVMTDGVGLALLVPWTREWLKQLIKKKIEKALREGKKIRISYWGP